MAHLVIFTTILFYIVIVYVLGSVVGLLTFPPPAFQFEFLGWSELGLGRQIYRVEWTGMLVFISLVCVGLVIFLNLVNVEVLGTGLNIDARHLSTIIVGVIISGFIGYSLYNTFPATTPFLVTLPLVWAPVIGLLYSMIYRAGT